MFNDDDDDNQAPRLLSIVITIRSRYLIHHSIAQLKINVLFTTNHVYRHAMSSSIHSSIFETCHITLKYNNEK